MNTNNVRVEILVSCGEKTPRSITHISKLLIFGIYSMWSLWADGKTETLQPTVNFNKGLAGVRYPQVPKYKYP